MDRSRAGWRRCPCTQVPTAGGTCRRPAPSGPAALHPSRGVLAVEHQPGVFTVLVHLPPGYHQYKFIVDGEWRHDETQPFMPDPLGNVNNWLFVRRTDLDHAQGAWSYLGSTACGGTSPGAAPPPALGVLAAVAQSMQAQVPHEDQAMSGHMGVPREGGQPGGSPEDCKARGRGARHLLETFLAAPDTAFCMPLPQMEDEEERGVVVMPENEPEATKRKILDFLNSHTAYELIPGASAASGDGRPCSGLVPTPQGHPRLPAHAFTSTPQPRSQKAARWCCWTPSSPCGRRSMRCTTRASRARRCGTRPATPWWA